MSVVEQQTHAHILTDTDGPVEVDGGTVPLVLRYDPEDDPPAVRFGVPPATDGPAGRPREWTVDRSLLERGLKAPADEAGVRVWPCGRVQAVVEFHSPQGCSMVQIDSKALLRFLRLTHAGTDAPAAR
ncbi:SsgA family sporulation/cell division regulator [Streptomyces sp. ZYX-F-203]